MVSSLFFPLLVSCSYVTVILAATVPLARDNTPHHKKDATVLILGGGVSGIIAAQTLNGKGITDFKIIEARDELGGRLHSETFGEPGRQVTVEVGSLVITLHQFTFMIPLYRSVRTGSREPVVAQVKDPKIPSGLLSRSMVSRLAKVLTTVISVRITTTVWRLANCFPAMFDENGPANFTDIFDEYEAAYTDLTVAAGARVDQNLVDTTARTGYGMIDVKPKTPHEMAVEYYTFDWEYAQTPEVLFQSLR
jgi:polyamine oxidase